MLARVIENWLDKAGERTWQRPFCAMLMAQGYRIVHSSRHMNVELGVDVLAVSPNDELCAYQLKGTPSGRLTLNQWDKEVTQVDRLAARKISHPSIGDKYKNHRTFFVVDGEIEEEVQLEIRDRNAKWKENDQAFRKIETIERGKLLDWARKLGSDLWPSELSDARLLLEVYLSDGRAPLPKDKLAELLESVVFLHSNDGDNIKKTKVQRAISSAAILCGIAISEFSTQKNHSAEIEAWTVFISIVLGAAKRWGLSKNQVKAELAIGRTFLMESLLDLQCELKEREHLFEGDPSADNPFGVYGIRVTWLVAMMSILAFEAKRSTEFVNEQKSDILAFCHEFIGRHENRVELWGEGAVPLLLAYYHYLCEFDGSSKSDKYLERTARFILDRQLSEKPLAPPYCDATDVIRHEHGLPPSKEGGVPDCRNQSYSIRLFIFLLVQENWKQAVKLLWPDFTRITLIYYAPVKLWNWFRWRNINDGQTTSAPTKIPDNWERLRAEVARPTESPIVSSFDDDFVVCSLWLTVYPHRCTAEVALSLQSIM